MSDVGLAAITALLDGGPLAEMEAAITARLVAAFPKDTFAHEMLPPKLTQTSWGRLTKVLPCVGMGIVDITPNPGISHIWRGTAQWQLLLIAKNSTLRLQMLGDSKRAGLFGMMCVAVSALQGMPIANIGSAQVGKGGPVYDDSWANEELAIASLLVSVPFTLVDGQALAELDDLLRVGVTWVGIDALPPGEVINVRDP